MKASLCSVASAAALLSAFLFSCSKHANADRATAGQEKPRLVKTARVELNALERAMTVTGSLAAQEQATLSVKIPGRLEAISVDLGSTVQKGDLIAQLERDDYELRLKQAAAALAQARAVLGLASDTTDDQVDPSKVSIVKQAKAVLDEAAKNRERVSNLSNEGISPKAELDTAEAAHIVALNRYESALEEAHTRQAILAQRRAELDLARQQLTDTAIHAPFGGAIQTRQASLGEYLPAGAPVVTLVKTDPLRLRLEVPERESIRVRLGQLVRLVLEGVTNVDAGNVARLSPAINEQNRMLLVEADVPNYGSLRPGLFVRAQIITSERDEGLTIPINALITFAGLEKVLVVKNDKALEKTVTTGRRAADWVEIVSGLKAGELVVIDPGNLRTGEPVTTVPEGMLHTSKEVQTSGP
jgi:RND family efflux transporter MFP subunit